MQPINRCSDIYSNSWGKGEYLRPKPGCLMSTHPVTSAPSQSHGRKQIFLEPLPPCFVFLSIQLNLENEWLLILSDLYHIGWFSAVTGAATELSYCLQSNTIIYYYLKLLDYYTICLLCISQHLPLIGITQTTSHIFNREKQLLCMSLSQETTCVYHTLSCLFYFFWTTGHDNRQIERYISQLHFLQTVIDELAEKNTSL